MSECVLISVKTRSVWLYTRWEAWVERDGRVIKSTFDFGWTEEQARKRAMRRWGKLQTDTDVPGTRKETPIPCD